MQLPTKLDTRRSHKLIQFFLKRSEKWSKENRDFSIYWSTSHMTTTAQTMRLLAVLRGLDPEFCAIAGAIHDIATMESGKAENHAERALDFLEPLVHEFNQEYEKHKITNAEIARLKEIIPQHSDKAVVSNDPYVEILKDADAIDRYLHGVETKEAEMPRLEKALSELGMEKRE